MIPIHKKTDHELIAMCQSGSDSGFTGLYERYARRTYNSIHRIVSHTAEAEDILQESFLTAFKEIGKLSEVASFEAWVKRVAINKSISHLRKKKIEFSDIETTEIEAEKEYDPQENEQF
ncbi:MAG: RNA polymerase sigma factor, partial [Bacteroidia bacterium]